MDPRALELLNLELDGRLDAPDRAALDALLAADPAARKHREQLRAVVRALKEAPAPAVPLDFADGVLRQAELPRRARRPRYWRAGWALAASVLAAWVLLSVTDPDPGPPGPIAATLAPAPTYVRAARSGEMLTLEFNLAPGEPGDIVIDFTGGAPASVVAPAGVASRIEGGRIVLPQVGPGRLTVHVAGDLGNFTPSLVRDGSVTVIAVRP